MRRSKPRSFLMLAYLAGSMAPLLHSLLRWGIGIHRFADDPRQPALSVWLRLYRSSDRAARAMLAGLGLDADSPRVQQLLGRGESAGAKLALPVPEEDILRALADLVPQRSDAKANRLLQSVLESPAGQFLVLVALPCAILHREHPTRLLRRARLGDLDAFETLLRLDKSVVFDRGLARRWHELMQHPKPAVRKRLFSALAGRPRPKMDAKSIRSALAGLLSGFAEQVGSSVTARELRTVFTFFAEDGYLADSEMPAGEALTKAIQRHRPRSRKPASREAPGQ